MLSACLLGNPHSGSPSASAAAERVEAARCRVLRHFNVTAATHCVVFTSGATAGLRWVPTGARSSVPLTRCRRMVADAFDYGPAPAEATPLLDCGSLLGMDGSGPLFSYLVESHTSVVGMRELALDRGVAVRAVSDAEVMGWCRSPPPVGATSLFAASAQCNFSGRKLPLDWVAALRDAGRWCVLLDAAAWVATSPLDLSQVPADFVALSFYKMFGLPTGLGALVVRREAVSAAPSRPLACAGR